jgi:hypothetical protein
MCQNGSEKTGYNSPVNRGAFPKDCPQMREFDLRQGYFPRFGYTKRTEVNSRGSCKERGGFMSALFVAAMGGIWLLIVVVAMMPMRGNSDNE